MTEAVRPLCCMHKFLLLFLSIFYLLLSFQGSPVSLCTASVILEYLLRQELCDWIQFHV